MTSAPPTRTPPASAVNTLKRHAGIFALLILFTTLKIFFLAKPPLIGWDESVYLGMGKYIYSLGTAGLWEEIRPPLLPLLFGLGWKLGFNTILFAQSVILTFSLGTLLLTYFLALKLFPSRTLATLASALLASTPIFFSHSSLLLTDIPAVFFVLFALLLTAHRHSPWLIGAVCALAFLTRFPAAALLIPLSLNTLWPRTAGPQKTRIQSVSTRLAPLLHLAAGFFLITLPFLVFNYLRYYQETENWLDAAFRPIILGSLHQANPFYAFSGTLHNLTFYLKELFAQHPLLILSIPGFALLLLTKKQNSITLLATLATFLAYFTWIPNKQVRFSLLFLPFLAIASAYTLQRVFARLNRWKRYTHLTLPASFLLIGALLIPPISQNLTTYNWLPDEPHPLQLFYTLPLQGTVLTTLPMPAAYHDNLFIPAYDTPTIALSTYATHKDETSTFLYFSEFYPCNEANCHAQKDLLRIQFFTHQLTYYYTYNNQEYAILSAALD